MPVVPARVLDHFTHGGRKNKERGERERERESEREERERKTLRGNNLRKEKIENEMKE